MNADDLYQIADAIDTTATPAPRAGAKQFSIPFEGLTPHTKYNFRCHTITPDPNSDIFSVSKDAEFWTAPRAAVIYPVALTRFAFFEISWVQENMFLEDYI